MHICVNEVTIIGSDNGLSPGQHQAIIWTNAGILLIWPVGTNFSEISKFLYLYSENAVCKMSAILSGLQCVNQNQQC